MTHVQFAIDPPARLRPRVGIFHPWMSLGGSEAVTLWAIDSLKHDHEVTLVTPAEFSLRELNFAFGTSLMPWEINIMHIPTLPGRHSAGQLPRLRLNHFESHARRLAPQFDLCVSGYNPMDFGRPGIHLVGDFAWDAPFSDQLHAGTSAPLHAPHESPLYRSYGWLADHLFHWRRPGVFHRADRVVAISRWIARHLHEHYHVVDSPVVPPPVPMPPPAWELRRDPLGFAWIGRFTREKRFEMTLEILTRLRERGHDITLSVIGGPGDDAYSREIESLAAGCSWIRMCGPLTGEDKWDVLRQQSFALHTSVAEAFGIGVAEMAACGCVPIVPADSGAAELMNRPDLAFHSANEAVEKIDRLLRQPDDWPALSALARESALEYRPEVFVQSWRRLVADFLASQPAAAAE